MKKLIKLEFNNTTKERKTEDSYSELYSHDKNNGSFEFEILNETLTTEQVTALFKFTESNKIWKTTGTVEGNKVKVTFDTTLITQNETVICYLYFDEEQRTSDTFRFKFKVKVSEIDKMNRYEVKERFINNTVIVDKLDVVTKEELKEALKNVGGIATEGLLTEVKAEETYAKKSEAVDNTNFELVKNRVLALELKTDKDTVYDDSELKGRISILEAREDKNTIYDDTSVRERLTVLENKPNVDISNLATKEELETVRGSQPNIDNLVTRDELENKRYISDISNLATKEELQEVRNSQPVVDTSNLVTRDELTAKNFLTEHQPLDNLVTKQELEEKHYLTTHQDLSEYAKKSELYNDSDLKARVEVLEQKTDNDTVYDDTPLKERVTTLESRAIEGGTYDDSDLRNRVVALESKEDKDTKYDDTEVKHRLTELENKPVIDTSVFVTEEKLSEKGYLTQHQSLENVVTKEELANKKYVTEDELNNKGYLTQHQDLSNYVTSEQLENKHYLTQHQPLDNLVTKEELNSKGYVTDEALNSKGYLTEHQNISHLVTNDELNSKGYLTEEVLNSKNYLTEDVLNTKNYLTQHQDLSSLVTRQELENKHYLTEHQPLSHLVTTSDLEVLRNISVNKAEFNSFKDNVVTKTELAEKGYLTTQYDDTDVKNRIQALENRPTTGGTQIQDTGWLKVSGENAIAENIVEIRRIANTVHVRFRNENGDFIIVENIYSILDKEISGGFGSVTNNSPIFSSKNNRELGRIITNVSDNRITVELSIDVELSVSKSVYINEFSYITDEPFPTNLH